MQGIFYQVQGTAVTYEYYVSRAGTQGSIYHFTVKYDSASAGVFTVQYYSTGSSADPHANGAAASVGMQGGECSCSFVPVVDTDEGLTNRQCLRADKSWPHRSHTGRRTSRQALCSPATATAMHACKRYRSMTGKGSETNDNRA